MNWLQLNGWAMPCADNTTLDAGSGGDTIATDDISGVKYPRSKIVIGADGTNDGDVSSSNPLPVGGAAAEDAAASGAPVPAGGRYDSTPRTLDDGDRGEIALDADGAVHVADGGNSLTVDDGGSSLTVDGTVAISGTVAVTDNSGTLSVDDAGGNLSIDDGGNSITVDNGGAFAVQVDGDALTALQLIDDAVADEGAALGKGVLLQGDDGTDRTNVLVDTDGHLQVDVLSSNSLTVDLGSNNDVVQSTHDNFNANANVQQGDSDVGSGNPLEVTLANGSVPSHAVTNAGTFAVQSTLQAGTALVGQVAPAASTAAAGTSTFYDNDLDETKQEVTDNSTVRIYSIQAFNTTDGPLFLQLFDLDADNVTVGTTTPTNQYVIPGNADSDGAGFVITFPVPKAYSTGFTVACTTDSQGSSAPGAGACIVNIEYVSAA